MSVLKNSSAPTLETFVVSMGESMSSLPPIRYLLVFFKIIMEFLMDRMVLAIISFLLGMATLLIIEFILFKRFLSKTPPIPPPMFEDAQTHLPQVLKNRLDEGTLKQKEDCVWLNFLLQFLFYELKDSLQLRRVLTKKIQMEFEDVLKSKSGFLVDELFLRDFRLGDKFPVFMGMLLERSDVSGDIIQTLNLRTQIIYDGGFQIAIDAALPFSRVACVSVTVLKLNGLLRLQFTQLPYSHWNISFYEEPELELDVTAQLDGRPMPKLRNIIANQIRKIIRKKHTLPMYKMRFKPFFHRGLDQAPVLDTQIQVKGAELGCGILEVTVIEASRLPFVVRGAQVFCTVSVDALPWKDQMLKERRNRKVITVQLIRNSNDQTLGMMLRDELLPDRLFPVVLIGQVNVGSPAHMANVQQGDILVAVGGNKVTSAKHAMKNFKWAKDRIYIQIEKTNFDIGSSTDEVLYPRKVNSWHEGQKSVRYSDSEAQKTVRYSDSEAQKTVRYSDSEGQKTVRYADSDTLSISDSLQFTPGSFQSRSKSLELPEPRCTPFTDASVNPQWNHKIAFSVDLSVKFLNICLWSRGGDRTTSPDVISSSKQDVLLGYVSLSLNEIYLHCLITLNGTMQDKVQLKHGHYKTQDELIKTWSVHKGWDLNQMYGDISLGFHYIPTTLSKNQRQVFSGSKRNSIKLKNQLYGRYDTDEDEQVKSSPKRNAEYYNKRDFTEGHHQFDNTTFMTATFCDYCGKKIWMKEAFKCLTCSMVCHKKCLVKCLVNTVCTDAGVKKRNSTFDPWEPLTKTGKTKYPVATDEVVRNYGYQEEDLVSQDAMTLSDFNMNTSEPAPSLTNLLEAVSGESEQKELLTQRKQDITQEVNPLTRFRGLKEQTDRMKDNVLKHLRRNKVPAAFNDKDILSAKELGARLFIDMEPSLRKDKLEELVKKLDQELKAEMENKESVEQELALLEIAEQKLPNSKRKSELRSLSNRILKSVEKQDAMRLLMLQYCSGLQNCINSLEAEVNLMKNQSEFVDGHQTSQTDYEPPKTSRSAVVGGFVRRASSSVKEKMSLIKKDFGKKGLKSGEDDKSTSSRSNMNSGLNVIEEGDDLSSQDSMEEANLQQRSINQSKEDGDNVTNNNEVKEMKDVSRMTEMSAQMSEEPLVVSQPAVEIYVDEVGEAPASIEVSGDKHDPNEPSVLSQEGAGIPRSSSDSSLEISKVLSLRPEDILRYRGTSLPRLLASDESDSESDYLVIDSSDEHDVTDSSDSEKEEDHVGFKDGKKKPDQDDSDDGRGHSQSSIQKLQTFQV